MSALEELLEEDGHVQFVELKPELDFPALVKRARAELAAQQARIRELEGLLKRLEWADANGDRCGICGSLWHTHAPYCELAAALASRSDE